MRGSRLVDEVALALQAHFAALGYHRLAPAPLVAGSDPSVLFTGSVTSVVKPYLLERRIPCPGLVLLQPALRTQNLKLALDRDACPGFCSYFPAFGTLSSADRLDDVAHEVLGGLATVRAGADRADRLTDRLIIRASSGDADLLRFWQAPARRAALELDACPPIRYQHRYGVDGVSGRNYNFAVRTSRGIEEFGNLIVIEQAGAPLGVELALGLTTLLARLHDAPHPIWFSPISELLPLDSPAAIKLADCLTAAIALLREGLRPVVTNRGRILRRYLQAASVLGASLGLGADELAAAAERYEEAEFGSATQLAAGLRAYLTRHAALVASGASADHINRALAGVL